MKYLIKVVKKEEMEKVMINITKRELFKLKVSRNECVTSP